jgi:L,D-transpeptidase ErfK/SrfK
MTATGDDTTMRRDPRLARRLVAAAAFAALMTAGCTTAPPTPPSARAQAVPPAAPTVVRPAPPVRSGQPAVPTATSRTAPTAAPAPTPSAALAPRSANQVTSAPLPPLTRAERSLAQAQPPVAAGRSVAAAPATPPTATPPTATPPTATQPGAVAAPGAPTPGVRAPATTSAPASPPALRPAAPAVAAGTVGAGQAVASDVASAPPPAATHADEVIGDLVVHRTRYEDTLLDLGVTNSLGFLEIMAANPGVDPWLPGEGTEVLLPKARILPTAPREGIVLNLAEQRLFFFRKGELVETFPIGVFRDGFSTPLGSTTVVRKTVNPTWYPPPSARADDPELPAMVPPGPDNPLGTRAMYLGWPRYLIHGTHKPYGVGRRVSRGCIRMYPADVERLYDMVAVGTKVHVVNQPVKVGWWRGELFVQAHPTIEQGVALEETGRIEPVEIPDIGDKLRAKAGPQAGSIDWPTVTRALKERRGVPVQVTNVGSVVAGDPRQVAPARTPATPLATGTAGLPDRTGSAVASPPAAAAAAAQPAPAISPSPAPSPQPATATPLTATALVR